MGSARGGGDVGQQAELERQVRLVDQALTMQAALRDRDARISLLLTAAIGILSTVGVAFAFATTTDRLTLLGVTADRATWLGWLALSAAFLSVLDLVTDRRGASRRRGEAVALLTTLKGEYREAISERGDAEAAAELANRYLDVVTRIPEIPERLFNRLKARHLLKVEVSRELSAHPGISSRRARRRVVERANRGLGEGALDDRRFGWLRAG